MRRAAVASTLTTTRSPTTGQPDTTDARSALVTGAAGFVGSHVSRSLLERGFDVHAVVRDAGAPIPRLEGATGLRLEQCDLTDAHAVSDLVGRIAPGLCIHCAWIATPGEYLSSPANALHVAAAETLAQALVESGCKRLIALGTCLEYAPSDAPLRESSPLGPATPYGRAKVSASQRLARLCDGTDTTFAWARLFYLYGPHEDPRRLVPAVTLALLSGREAPTTAGEQRRDFLHVDDVASALVSVATSQVTGPVNIGAGRVVTVREVVETIGELTGRSELLRIGALPNVPGDPMVVAADVSILASTGFAARRTLADGLADTVAWWAERLGTR